MNLSFCVCVCVWGFCHTSNTVILLLIMKICFPVFVVNSGNIEIM